MALNTSGPISLGGNTAGQSIAAELSLNPTAQISLNDTNVRTLAGVPSGAIIMPTNFYGKANTVPITATANQTARSYTATQVITSFTPLTAANGVVPYTYSVSSGTLPTNLSIAPTTGLVSGTVNTAYPAANVTFTVKDSTNTFATTTSTVNFTVFAQTTATAVTTARVYTNGQGAITAFNPLTAANGTGTYTYSIQSGTLPTGLSLNPSTGSVTGSPTANYSVASVVFRVADSNGIVAATTSSVSFTVNAATTATAVTTARVYTNGQGAIASFNPLTAANGTTPYTYSVQSGTLPGGLSLNSSTGLVSGTPNANYGAASVVFRVTDANGVVAATTSSVSFTVNAATTATADTTARSGQTGTAITAFNPLTAANGTTPYTYSIQSGTLPTGLSLNPSTGSVSGTPSVAYPAASVVFRVTDTNGVVAGTTSSVQFTYTAAPVPVSALLVAGGGAGGSAGGSSAGQGAAGGGGGGGVGNFNYGNVPKGTVLTITIGAGGAFTPVSSTTGSGARGNPTTITGGPGPFSIGGGGGGLGFTPLGGVGATTNQSGLSVAGSGGGGGSVKAPNFPSFSGYVGQPGGASGGGGGNTGGGGGGGQGGPPFPSVAQKGSGGGGGGAGGAGGSGGPLVRTSPTPLTGGTGGAASPQSFLTGTVVFYGGGGGGGSRPAGAGVANPATGGGGGPGAPGSANATNPSGTANSGGGGAGGGLVQGGGGGGSGTVVISVPTPQVGTRTGTTTTGTNGATTWFRWTSPGTYTV
jgi:hypothetical protein